MDESGDCSGDVEILPYPIDIQSTPTIVLEIVYSVP